MAMMSSFGPETNLVLSDYPQHDKLFNLMQFPYRGFPGYGNPVRPPDTLCVLGKHSIINYLPAHICYARV
ncbi:hypothetical protein QJS10_CPA07g00455 [Acorus calamus]|uniref:Uncharacterized protein n=1 Tax=Acorus calamus TaxID=4465 RepID=A0AAV9EG69_ACOCL|nr:hypothetical protein QJS10_CPA07g00455 [Acorus calamus]